MKTKIPVKDLVLSNWLMAITCTGFLSVFLFAFLGITSEVIFTIIQSGFNILLISFFNIVVLVQVSKRAGTLSLKQQRFYRYTIAYIITVIFSFGTRRFREFFADESWKVSTFEQQLIAILAGSLILNIIIFMMHNLVIAYHQKNDAEIENEQLKLANVEANNLLLRQQIHPHFLFNALSILKTLYKKDANAADEYLVHLSSFLRAGISNTTGKVVPLADELQLCNDYIVMQKIRFGDALIYKINISENESKKGFLPSFSLQPLLENAIKHNDITDKQPLSIEVFIKDGYAVVANNLQRKKQPVVSTGKGLENIIKRYQLLSGEEVVIKQSSNVFSVKLKILEA